MLLIQFEQFFQYFAHIRLAIYAVHLNRTFFLGGGNEKFNNKFKSVNFVHKFNN